MSINDVGDKNIRRILCSLKTEAEEGSPESPQSDSMMSEEGHEVFINDITHKIPQDLQEEEDVISTELYGADLQRTLGEILAYCQVTYGAILKLDEKFDMLQAKVANIQSSHKNPAQLSQTSVSSLTDSFYNGTESLLIPDLSMPHLLHVSSSSPLPLVESTKPPTLSPGPEVNILPTTTHNSTPEQSPNTSQTTQIKPQQGQVKSPVQTSSQRSHPNASVSPANTCCLGNTERKVLLSNCVLQKAGKMVRPSAAVRYLLRNIFTAKELSQSSTTGNPARRLKRLDPNKINAIREWAVKRYPKFDLREKGKDWKVCLSVMNSTARYFRFMDKTRKTKVKSNKMVTSEATVPSERTAEIDVELSDSDSQQKEHKPQKKQMSRNSVSDCDMSAHSNFNYVHLGPPHREVKVPEFALSAAHMRMRPELIARYLIKFIFPEDVLVCSNVYGARRGIQPLDHNKISALREHLSERFPWMRLEENGSDWKVCVGAINSTIRKFRYERKMGIKRGIR